MRFTIPTLSLGALALGAAPLAAASQTPTVRDLARIVHLADPHISPDGKTIALVEGRADLEHDRNSSEIVLVDTASHALRKLTRDRYHAASPEWSPDGGRIAFLAPDGGKKLQVFVLPMNGGDAAQITHAKDDVSQFAWSPDGTQIGFVTTDPAPDRKGEDKYRDAFQVGNDDFLTKEKPRPAHIWIVSADGGTARRLTSGAWSLPVVLPPGPPSSPIKFSRDGKSIVFVRQASPSTGDAFQTRVEVVDIASGQIRDLTGATTLEAYPVLSPDGAVVAYWRNRDAKPWFYQDVWLAPFAGGAGRDISAALDKNIYGTWWTPDGKSLVVGANDGTTVGLWTLSTSGAARRLDLGDVSPSNGYWVEGDVGAQGQIAFVGQVSADPYELYLVPAGGGAPQKLTDENASLANLALAKSEAITWKNGDGRVLDGVVTYPVGFTDGQKYPLVLVIHGGPNSASKLRFSLLDQMMAAKGWIVFEPNYRGSDNQDNAFFASIYQDAGQGPGEDVMAGVKALQDRGIVDASRIGVTGWSYGGFMTTWLLGHYNIWKAAVAGAAVTDWVDMYNLSDGNITVSEQPGGSPYIGDGMARYRKQSPDSSVTSIKAPTLVLCDVGDFRVPITQSYGLYRALKDNHVETEFYAYPVGGHFPGDPIRTMDVYQRWVDWLAAHLK